MVKVKCLGCMAEKDILPVHGAIRKMKSFYHAHKNCKEGDYQLEIQCYCEIKEAIKSKYGACSKWIRLYRKHVNCYYTKVMFADKIAANPEFLEITG